uniref:UPAR/Ly6 domain-containing protein n=1 Tax=Cyprinus carpio TaxID=7962 RepID=A0A8C2D3E9_CYPCA
LGGISTKVKLKYCAGDCQSGCINIGIAITLSVCCDADLCNSQDAPDPSSLVPSGKKCYSCDGQSFSNILSCSGSEEHCISATGANNLMVLKDCVSKSMCNTKTSVRDVQSVSCCEGNLCNGVQSVSQSFLFLCCSLISFILLH